MSDDLFAGKRGLWIVVGIVIGALAAGFIIRGWVAAPAKAVATKPAASQPAATEGKILWWTCSMHPQIHAPRPGRCPICGMTLIPYREETGAAPVSLRQFETTEAAKALMDIRTSRVERKFVTAKVRMVGKVAYDETRLGYITAWVPGRLDRLYVDYTGVSVKKGDPMVYLYSPEVLAAQEELLQAKQAIASLGKSEIPAMRESAHTMLVAAREKLRLWGLSEAQVAEIEKRNSVSDHITVSAPMGGVVIHKNALEGMYVQTGTRIYTIADLTSLWVQLDAYESDLAWLRYGETIEFTTPAYPGKVFAGRISFIAPFVDALTRTVKVRAEVPNHDGALKPEMFVHGEVRVQLTADGRVIAPELADKWICAKHPEIVRAQPGVCPLDKTPLVRAETYGYASPASGNAAAPLVIPASAPLITGQRAIVYLEVPDRKQPTFEGVEIVLGPRAGDFYIVDHGLKEGDIVVTSGNFKIDAALEIAARPSMMAPEGGATPTHMNMDMGAKKPGETGGKAEMAMPAPAALQAQIEKLIPARARVAGAVEANDLAAAKIAFADYGKAVAAVDAGMLKDHMALEWKELAMLARNDGIVGAKAKDMATARRDLDDLDGHLARIIAAFLPAPSAKPAVTPAQVPAAFQRRLGAVYRAYLAVQAALAGDDDAAAAAAAKKVRAALGAVDMKLLTGDAHETWMKEAAALRKVVEALATAKDIEARRAAFALVSEQLAVAIGAFGIDDAGPVYQLHCPMAFNNRGADWLQADEHVRNPYFGAAMPRCGDVVKTLVAPAAKAGEGGHE